MCMCVELEVVREVLFSTQIEVHCDQCPRAWRRGLFTVERSRKEDGGGRDDGLHGGEEVVAAVGKRKKRQGTGHQKGTWNEERKRILEREQ